MILARDARSTWVTRLVTWLLILLPPVILLAPALRPGYMMLPAQLPFQVDPLWQSLAPQNLGAANPVLSDQFYQYHAWHHALRHSLAQGEIAWWTPAINGGQPLVGNGQVGLLDPFNLAGLLFPLPTSYGVGALLRLWVAGGFTYLYARTIGLSQPAAWLALLTFSLSGLLVHWIGATPSHVLVWLPALLWAGERLLAASQTATDRWWWVLLAAILVAVLLFSSQPEIALQVGLAWGIYLLIRAAWREGSLWRGLRRHAWTWLVIACLGMALAAVELLPFVDALRHSVVFAHRAAAPELHGTAWLRHMLLDWEAWPTVVTTLLPNFLGQEQDESYWYPLGNSFENNAYAGVLPLLLAILALWAAWRQQTDHTHAWSHRWVWLWVALGVGALGLALEWPLLKALNDLPPFSLVAEGRWRGLYIFAVAILAAFGLDFILERPPLARTLARLLIAAAAVNLLLVAAAYVGFTRYADQLVASGRAFMEANIGSPMLDRPLDELYALVETRQQAKLAMLLPSNPVMYLPLWVALATGLLLWWQRDRPMRAGLASALIAITWLDLMWTGLGINAAAPVTLLEPTPPVIAALHEQSEPFRIAGTQLILNPNMALLSGLQDVRGYDPLAVNRYQELLAGVEGYVAAGYHTYFRHVDDARLDRFNAAYALSRTPPSDARWKAVSHDPSGVTLYRSRSALPRAYLVYAAEVVDSPEEARTRTLHPDFAARQRVVLEVMPTGWTPPPAPPTDAPAATVRHQGANVREVVVNTTLPGILVLLETYIPGWRATIDGQPAPIYQANYAFGAVIIPAGQHTVRFSYAPPSLPLALIISGVAWTVVLGLLLWLYARTRVKRTRPAMSAHHRAPPPGDSP